MKIAIISDSHDNIPNIDTCLNYLKANNINTIIHCGDVCNPQTLEYLLENFKGDIYISFGNADYERVKLKVECDKYDNVECFYEVGEVELKNIKIAFIHFPDEAKEIAKRNLHHFVFHGHTHKPWIEQIGNTFLCNPGTLSGMFNQASFAVFDLDEPRIELKPLKILK